MTTYKDALQTVRRDGVRLTPQRLLILSIVANGNGHMGVDELLGKARESYPFIDVSTVYRTLHLFKKLGVVTEVAIGDRLHYELTDADSRHHHMVCRLCGNAFDLSPRYLEDFSQALVAQYGFSPDLDHFTVSGTCSSCAKPHGDREEG